MAKGSKMPVALFPIKEGQRRGGTETRIYPGSADRKCLGSWVAVTGDKSESQFRYATLFDDRHLTHRSCNTVAKRSEQSAD